MRTSTTTEGLQHGLTAKQVEVLDLLIEHHSTKQIARILQISPSAVDQRIYGAADRLGESDRRQLARKYAALKNACEKPIGEFSQVQITPQTAQSPAREADARGIFTFRDAASFESFAPWNEDDRLPLLEKLDTHTGPLGRLAVIVAIATLLALLLLASFVIARTLDGLI